MEKKERLIIKNFGPIQEVDIELGRMTVLIGDQATGKSTIAKVLAMCRYFSFIVNYRHFDGKISSQETFQVNEQFQEGLISWGLFGYLQPNSSINYTCPNYNFEFEFTSIIKDATIGFNTYTRLEPFNGFKKLIEELEELRQDDSKEEGFVSNEWYPNENFYRLNVKKVMDNPLYMPTERALQTVSFGKELLVSDAIIDELNKINRILRSAKNEWPIKHLGVSYKNVDGQGYVKKDGEDNYHPLYHGASGYQASIPIASIIQYHNIAKRKRTFIVEEPELNLFPTTQKRLMEFVAESINLHDHSFLIPTHSPYVPSSVNNFMYAYKMGNLAGGKYKQQIAEIIPEKYWLNPAELSAYKLEKGTAINILDEKEGLIDLDFLDSVSISINKEFDALLAIDVQHNEEEHGL